MSVEKRKIRKINDAEEMKRYLAISPITIKAMGEELSNDPEFVLEILDTVKRIDRSFLSLLNRQLGEKLKQDIDFIIKYIEKLVQVTGFNTEDLRKLISLMPKDLIMGNEKFWNTMENLGVINRDLSLAKYRYPEGDFRRDFDNRWLYTGNLPAEERVTKRREFVKEHIDEIDSENLFMFTSAIDRNNPEFMLYLMTRKASFYVCLEETLKKDKQFIDLALQQNPEIKEFIDAEKQQKEDERKEIQKKEQQKKEEEQQKIEKELIQQYKELGEKHPNLILVRNYLQSNTSKKLFCKNKSISEEKLNRALDEVGFVYPEIKEEIEKKIRQTKTVYLNTIDSIIHKLLSGEMTVFQFAKENSGKQIDDLLMRTKNADDRKKLQTIIMDAIASGNLSMMDYVRLFSTEYDYKTTIDSVTSYMRKATREVPELREKGKQYDSAQRQIKALSKYEKDFKLSDFLGNKKGFLDEDGKANMVTITDEHIEYAKKYLQLENEYICYLTMDRAISSLIKGEITPEEIDSRMEKRNAFLGLSKKEEEYQDLKQQAEITADQRKAAESLKNAYQGQVEEKETSPENN